MSKEREAELVETLQSYKHTEAFRLAGELFALRRERHRDRLEGSEDAEVRGRSKECKDLLQIFSV
jgi:hypothetical protein